MGTEVHSEKRVVAPAALSTVMRPNVLQRKCACGGAAGLAGECEGCRKKKLTGGALQKKLTINEPGDRYEQEADRVADAVIGMSDADVWTNGKTVPSALAQNTELNVSRYSQSMGESNEAPSIVHDIMNSPGQPLDPSTREFMGLRFGYDFNDVRVHTDGKAAESARSVSALAYTIGRDVVFGEGQYAPGTNVGQRLLAHELTHVVQQRGGNGSRAVQRFTVHIEESCMGKLEEIEAGAADAISATELIADPEARKCIKTSLERSHIVCNRKKRPPAKHMKKGITCGETFFLGDRITIHKWGDGCPSLPALLIHEAAHKCKIFGSEKFAEACENEAYGDFGASKPDRKEAGGKCELK